MRRLAGGIALFLWAAALVLAAPGYETLIGESPSRARDFGSLLYMQGDANLQQTRALFYRVRAPKPTHLNALAQKGADPALSRLLDCRNAATKNLLDASPECLAIALSPPRAEHVEPKERLRLADRVAPIDPLKAAIFRAMATPDPLLAAWDDADVFYAIVLQATPGYLRWNANRPIEPQVLARLQQDGRFSALLERVVVHGGLDRLAQSLALADPSQLDHKGALYLGFLALLHGDKPAALRAFEAAEAKSWSRSGKDRALFWLWRVSTEERYLVQLAQSFDVNFYALLAKERRGLPIPTVVSRVEPQPQMTREYGEQDFYNPFFWAALNNKIVRKDPAVLKAELAKLGHPAAESYRAAVELHLGSADTHYFLDPWPHLLEGLNVEQKAMFLAIMRQESRFIPAALSTSYAIGSMQMMPFLIEHMAKERREKNDVWNFFNPNRQIPYAVSHLKWLRARLAHPLHIAYAYNGGIGFTKRTLEGDIFKKGEYEPFLSLERIPIEEPREYGKIVLANYVVYRSLLGDPVSLEGLLQTLTPLGDLYPGGSASN
ncbi:MAG: transglycosylase SLT domain-containing protein [Campylobacterales bacterium]